MSGKQHGGCFWVLVIALGVGLAPTIAQAAGCAALLGIGLPVACVASSVSNNGDDSAADGKKGAKAKEPKGCVLKVVSHSVIKPYYIGDEKYLAVTVSWKNRSKSKTSFSDEIDVSAQQDGVVLSTHSMAGSNDSYRELEKNSAKTVVNGKTLKTAVFCELDDSHHPVKIKFTDRHTGKTVLKTTVKL